MSISSKKLENIISTFLEAFFLKKKIIYIYILKKKHIIDM